MSAADAGGVDGGLEGRRILVADDEETIRFFLRRALTRHGAEVVTVERGDEARDAFQSGRFDVVLLDLKMPGLDGLEALTALREADPDAVVVLMTGHGTIANAVDAMRRGAADVLTKPFELDALRVVLERALRQQETARENRALRPLVDHRTRTGGLVGQSTAMRAVFQTIDLVKDSDATVLIRGESGTGKELVARAIHLQSARRGGPFVPLNCAALPEALLENELYGHEPGAFTGATEGKRGLVERAHRGTLFLDEVSEIAPHVQSKLARFVQEQEYTPLGGSEPRSVDLRFLAATNRDLERAVEAGDFREELFWRLNVVPIHLPPLRERREDVPLLVEHCLARFRAEGKTRVEGFSFEAMLALSQHAWPGNVRELQNTVERLAVLHASEARLDVAHLPVELRLGAPAPQVLDEGAAIEFSEALRRFERGYFESLLRECEGNISETARRAGVSRPLLHRKIKQLGLEPDRHRPG